MNDSQYKINEAIIEATKVLKKCFVSQPPVPIEDIIEDYAIQLRFIDLRDRSSQISGLYDNGTKTIYVNANEAPARQRFTIAHELGHALLHSYQLEKNPNLGIFYRRPLGDEVFNSIEERQANCFAAHLLVPEAIIRELYPACKSPSVLADIFNVSRQVIEFHLLNLGLIAR